MRYGYKNITWKPGIYNVRKYKYEHPWIVVLYDRQVVGCWSRAEARKVWREGES